MIDIDKQFERSIKFIHWLINGYNRHGIPPNMWSNKHLTPEWVEEHYNINF